jgi:hypothetical protein
MSPAMLWSWIDSREITMTIGGGWLFPFLESVHVLAVAVFLGSILMLDLRMMELVGKAQPMRRMLQELTPWSWGAFLVSFLTGLGMFVTQSSMYMANPAFLIKMALLLLAGLNMAAFHRWLAPLAMLSNAGTRTSVAFRSAGAASFLLWVGVTLSGRWIGQL